MVLNTCSFIGPAREESDGHRRPRRAQEGRRPRRGGGRGLSRPALQARPRASVRPRSTSSRRSATTAPSRRRSTDRRPRGHASPHAAYLEGPGLRDRTRRRAAPRDARQSRRAAHLARRAITCSFCGDPVHSRAATLQATGRGLRGGGGAHRRRREGARRRGRGLTAWGRDFGMELPELVESVADLDGDARVRVMYAYPNRFPCGSREAARPSTPRSRAGGRHPDPARRDEHPARHATRRAAAIGAAGTDRLRGEVPDLTLRTTVLMGFPQGDRRRRRRGREAGRGLRLTRLGSPSPSRRRSGTPGFDLADRRIPTTSRPRAVTPRWRPGTRTSSGSRERRSAR